MANRRVADNDSTQQQPQRYLAICKDSFNADIPTINTGEHGSRYVNAMYPAPLDYDPNDWTTPELTLVRPPGHPDPYDENTFNNLHICPLCVTG